MKKDGSKDVKNVNLASAVVVVFFCSRNSSAIVLFVFPVEKVSTFFLEKKTKQLFFQYSLLGHYVSRTRPFSPNYRGHSFFILGKYFLC